MNNDDYKNHNWFKIFKSIYILLSCVLLLYCISIWIEDQFMDQSQKQIGKYIIKCDNGKEFNANSLGIYSTTINDFTQEEDTKARKLCKCQDRILNFILKQRSLGIDDDTILEQVTRNFYQKDDPPLYEYFKERKENSTLLVDHLINEAIMYVDNPVRINYKIKKQYLDRPLIEYAKKVGLIILATMFVGGLLVTVYELLGKILIKIVSKI